MEVKRGGRGYSYDSFVIIEFNLEALDRIQREFPGQELIVFFVRVVSSYSSLAFLSLTLGKKRNPPEPAQTHIQECGVFHFGRRSRL